AWLAARMRRELTAWEERCEHLEARAAGLLDVVGKLEAQLKEQSLELGRWATAFVNQVRERRAELRELAPWVAVLREAKQPAGRNGEREERWRELCRVLGRPLKVGGWEARRDELLAELATWQGDRVGPDPLPARLAEAVRASAAGRLARQLGGLASRADELAAAMDFGFLYNPDRHLFSIGFNLSLGRYDNAHYDLLASEANLASFLAIARG